MIARGVALVIAAFGALSAALFAVPAAAVEPDGDPVLGEAVETAISASRDGPARLVLAYWPRAGWFVRQTGREVTLTIPGAHLDIDTAAVTLPGGPGTITTLSSHASSHATDIRIGLGCDCTIAVLGDGARLVIDVVGADLAAGPLIRVADPAPYFAPAPAARGKAVAAGSDVGAVSSADVEDLRNRLLDELRRAAESGLVTLRPGAGGALAQEMHEGGQADPIPAPLHDIALAPDAAPKPGPAPIAPHPAMPLPGAQVRDRPGIAAESVTAQDTGLPGTSVRADGPPDHLEPTSVADAGIGVSESPADGATDPAADGQPAAGQGDAAAEAMAPDPDAPPYPPDALVDSEPAAACLASEAFRLQDPAPPAVLSAEISSLRRQLVDALDQPNVPAAMSLARLYLAHGMGVEALAVLDEFAPADQDTGLLAALAWLVEGRPLPVPGILSVPGCNGQHALWRAYDAAIGGRAAEALEHAAAASGALEQTGRGMRGRIAAAIGLAAVEYGDKLTAHRMKAMAKRSLAPGDDSGNRTRLQLEAALALERRNIAAARATLDRLRGTRSAEAAEAVLKLAELADSAPAMSNQQRDHLRLDLGVLALAHRDTPLGERAFLAETELTGRLFGRDAAFDLLAYGQRARLIDEKAYQRMLRHLGTALPEQDGDTPLALIYEANPARFSGALEEPGFRLALARSYVTLGVPVLGEAVVHAGDLDRAPLTGDLARSYLDTGDREAAARLAGKLPEGPGRAMIEAGIALARGDAAGALPALAAAGAPAAQRARTAWLAGDWQASAGALSEQISAVADSAGKGSEIDASRAGPDAPALPLAVRRAGALHRSGASPSPEAVSAVLAALPGLDPGLSAGLAVLFGPSGNGPAQQTPEGVSAFLTDIDAEMRLFEELLTDG